MTTYISRKKFKYDGEIIEPGDVFEPVGGNYDRKLIDPEYGYVRIVEDYEEEEVEEEPELYACEFCEREFDSPQGKAAHQRFCKEK